MSVGGGKDAAFCKHINNCWDKGPPEVLLIGVVEQAVLDPDLLVLVKE